MSARLAMLEQQIQKGHTDPFVWYARAMELRSLGRLEHALDAYEEVARRFPEYVPTFLMAGQVAEELQLREQARAWYERGVRAAQQRGDAHALGELQAALSATEQ